MTPGAVPSRAPQAALPPQQQVQQPQAPLQPQPQPLAQPERPPTIQEILGELHAWDNALLRSSAGFLSLDRAQRSRKGQLQEGERQSGLPILEWAATLSGTDSMKIGVDLKRVDPNYLDHVILPLQAALASEIQEAITEIRIRADTLETMLAPVLNPGAG